MKKYFTFYKGYLIGLFIIVIDQVSKKVALTYKATHLTPIWRIFHLPPIKNRGVSLNLFSIEDPILQFFLKVIGVLSIGYLLFRLHKKNNSSSIFGEVLLIAGGIGNFIDRILYDSVIDFIFLKIPFLNYIAIGNIADISITIGCIILMIELLTEDIS